MKFEELDVVKTLIEFPDKGIEKGEVGTIVHIFSIPNEAYLVEFINKDGSTKAEFPILPENIILVWSFNENQ